MTFSAPEAVQSKFQRPAIGLLGRPSPLEVAERLTPQTQTPSSARPPRPPARQIPVAPVMELLQEPVMSADEYAEHLQPQPRA